jgi:NAD(P)-dependent dehydrogenase (short-subunit alcohol dehydrogenase family)
MPDAKHHRRGRQPKEIEDVNRLQGKVAIITGAGGGIGRSICAQFLAEGASVAATDIDGDAAARAVGREAIDSGRAIALSLDAGDADGVRGAVQRAVQGFGALSVLVNIAGGASNEDGLVTEASEDEFWRVMRLDLFGTFLVCKYGIPELIRAGGGSVINMTSMTALVGVANRTCYSAAKGGVAAMTRSMAVGYAQHLVRVNAIAPGITLTPRVTAMVEASESLRKQGERHLLGFVKPEDVAHTAIYLASDESRVVTGQVLQVDSGVTIH